MSILVTGASGFVGRNLCNHIEDVVKLYNNNPIDNGIKCDLRDINQVKSVFEQRKITSVIHLAANPSPKHPENVKVFLEDHILSTANLLECSHNIPFIYMSSILVYGNGFPQEKPSNLYGACKLSCEKICEAYAVSNHLKLSIIRACAIVGPGLTHGLLFDIKRKIKLDNEYLELFGNEPGTIKPFVHIDDVINYILEALSFDSPTITDCFPSDNASVKEAAETFMDALDIHKPIKWLGDETIWKGDNRLISAKEVNHHIPLIYKTSIEAIKNAV